MKWYNRIFRRLGQRRLFTREEFIIQVAYELANRDKGFMIMPRAKYRMLLEIAACADLSIRYPGLPIQQRLQQALIDYKLSNEAPPSTNAHEEQHLMSMGGFPASDHSATISSSGGQSGR